jgi:hypothetical protein
MRTAIAVLTLFAVCGPILSGCADDGKSEGEDQRSVGDNAAYAAYADRQANVAAAEASLAAEATAKEQQNLPINR